MKKLVIGILAHVDSGKTTLAEGLLYQAGEIRTLGRVDHKNTFLDTHTIERQRGITIFSKQAVLHLKDAEIALLDTPGHVDFSTEMERTLRVLDYAILVISAVDGVQSHTETLWKLLKSYNIPTFVFVNKMDSSERTANEILTELKEHFSDSCIDFSIVQNQEQFFESVALNDEALLSVLLKHGSISHSDISKSISVRKVFPCYFGSALKLEHVDKLLAGISDYTTQKTTSKNLGAIVYKVSTDEQNNKVTHLKITSGTLQVKSMVASSGIHGVPEKINQIRIYSGQKYNLVDQAKAGMACAITGAQLLKPGDGIGIEKTSQNSFLQPVLAYRVTTQKQYDLHSVLRCLKVLEQEDPQLHVVWDELLGQIQVQIMGEVQLDVLKSIIKERFLLDVQFDKGSIMYKETILNTVEGVGHFEPLRHYAEVHVLLEPAEINSGVHISANCREETLEKNWQKLVLSHLEEKQHIGVLTGSPISDMKITLVSGRAHNKHTEGGDFRQATYRAVRQGLCSAQSVLLEPIYEFRLELPTEAVGRAMTDIKRMCGEFSVPQQKGTISIILGTAPVATMRDYQTELLQYTHGKARISFSLSGYAACHNTNEVINAIGYERESDTQNTADSVFCEKGSGYIVKWDKVASYMHIENVLKSEKAEQSDEQKITVSKRQVANYCASLEQDKELLKIFERTYGPIRKDLRTAMHTEKGNAKAIDDSHETFSLPMGEEYLLVDGYNIIFAWEDLAKIAADNLDAARSVLINRLCNYQGFCKSKLILVFDAYKVKGSIGGVETHHNISVVYTKEAETADMYIEKVTYKLAKTNRIRVATSDGMEQMIILGHGARRLSALAFYEEVVQVEKAIAEIVDALDNTK